MIHHLIRTASKSKIPQGFSYPLGAEIISEALADVPQYELLSIRFSSFNVVGNPKVEKPIETGECYVLQITYYTDYQCNYHYPWHISVGALPSEHKHAAQEALKAVLPEVHHWLSHFTPGNITYYSGINYLYNFKTGQLSRQDKFK